MNKYSKNILGTLMATPKMRGVTKHALIGCSVLFYTVIPFALPCIHSRPLVVSIHLLVLGYKRIEINTSKVVKTKSQSLTNIP